MCTRAESCPVRLIASAVYMVQRVEGAALFALSGIEAIDRLPDVQYRILGHAGDGPVMPVSSFRDDSERESCGRAKLAAVRGPSSTCREAFHRKRARPRMPAL